MDANETIKIAVDATHKSACHIEGVGGSNAVLLRLVAGLNKTLPQNGLVAVVMPLEAYQEQFLAEK